jgi:hypothetical protein
VSQVWLEWDRPTHTPFPEPVLCARIASDADISGDALAPVAAALRGASLPPPQQDLFAESLDAVPDGATLLYLFGLGARGSGAIRVEIAGLDAFAMGRYLARLDAPARGAVAAVAPLIDLSGRTHLSVEVGDRPARILPRTGVELSFQGLAGREPGWERLLDALVERNLATPEQCRGLSRWVGQSTFWSDPATWPADEWGLQGAIARCLSHVKLICRPDRPPEAKAYLLYQFVKGRSETPR